MCYFVQVHKEPCPLPPPLEWDLESCLAGEYVDHTPGGHPINAVDPPAYGYCAVSLQLDERVFHDNLGATTGVELHTR